MRDRALYSSGRAASTLVQDDRQQDIAACLALPKAEESKPGGRNENRGPHDYTSGVCLATPASGANGLP